MKDLPATWEARNAVSSAESVSSAPFRSASGVSTSRVWPVATSKAKSVWSREVGEALAMLLEARLEEGPLGEEEALRRLDEWWAARA